MRALLVVLARLAFAPLETLPSCDQKRLRTSMLVPEASSIAKTWLRHRNLGTPPSPSTCALVCATLPFSTINHQPNNLSPTARFPRKHPRYHRSLTKGQHHNHTSPCLLNAPRSFLPAPAPHPAGLFLLFPSAARIFEYHLLQNAKQQIVLGASDLPCWVPDADSRAACHRAFRMPGAPAQQHLKATTPHH
ncbi:hypothetical protein B0T25DRAFT_523036 [Lasiosphaeria hispida]|uniref:Secreted protein n=1 Tax=Lasiosphaeria hispida TaxID=260671 RepID=A0AAJ0M8L2_9PEZI|nr:hypothetical protein B0T25DRAFT_523036 [Lasiosphaeria hispida]